MRTVTAVSVSVGAVGVLVMCGVFHPTNVAGQGTQPRANSSAPPAHTPWPLPAAAKQYGVIDGKHLWQLVQEQADIARRYRDQGHPQYWGRIAGTSGDVEDADWLMKKYQQIGLTDTHIQDVVFFYPQWAPKSWEVTVTAGGKTIPLTTAQDRKSVV